MNKDQNRFQLRKTKEDVRNAQEKLRTIIKRKIKNNIPLSNKEISYWYRLCSDSFFARGAHKKVFIEIPGLTIPMGSVHSFALRFLDWNDSTIKLKYKGNTITFQIRFLWKVLLEYTYSVFPLSLDEAWHLSKESFEPNSGGSFSFSAKKNLNGV